MYHSKDLVFQYLMDMKKGIEIHQALRENYADEEQIKRAQRFVDTCECLAKLHVKIVRRNQKAC